MKRFIILSAPFLCYACSDVQNRKEEKAIPVVVSKYTYIDSRDTFNVVQDETDTAALETKSTVSLTSRTGAMRSYSGNYADHFKTGEWKYQTGQYHRSAINWEPAGIGEFIRTNLPANGTLTQTDVHTYRFSLPAGMDSIFIQFHADTLSARVKRRPYEDLIKDMMQNQGYTPDTSVNKLLMDSSNVVSITGMKFTHSGSSKKLQYQVAYAVLPSGYVAFAVGYSPEQQTSAELLFDGVLTNLFMNGQRMYYPFRKNENSGTLPAAKSE